MQHPVNSCDIQSYLSPPHIPPTLSSSGTLPFVYSSHAPLGLISHFVLLLSIAPSVAFDLARSFVVWLDIICL